MSRQRVIFPLYGARHVPEQRSRWPHEEFRLGQWASGLECVLPSAADWHFLQPSEATDPEGMWDLQKHLPWPCIVAGEGYSLTSALAAAADAMRSLRLVKPGWFLDPALSEVIHDYGDGRLTRAMGAYRLLFHDEDAERSQPPADHCIQLAVGDFAVSSPLHTVFTLLQEHRADPAVSAEVALEAFGRSYGCQLAAAQRIMLLHLALEIMLGQPKGKDGAAALAQRLAAALALGGDPLANDTATWFFATVRPLRNDVAHGRRVDGEAHAATVRRLTGLARSVLVRYLQFSRQWAAGDSAECTKAFNEWLSHIAAHGISDDDRQICGASNWCD